MKANGRPPPHSAPIEACPLQQRHEKASPRLKTSAPHVRPLRGIGEAASLVTRAAETQVRLRRSTGKAELALPAQRRQPSKPPESSESPKLLLPLKKKKKKNPGRGESSIPFSPRPLTHPLAAAHLGPPLPDLQPLGAPPPRPPCRSPRPRPPCTCGVLKARPVRPLRPHLAAPSPWQTCGSHLAPPPPHLQPLSPS